MSSALPETVECLLQPDFQKPALIRSSIPIQLPAEKSNEHLIRVSAFAPCAHELLWGPDFPGTFASNKVNVPCFDFTGTVVLAPPGSQFPPGSQVYSAGNFSETGSAREYTVTRASELALKPKSLSWEESASVPISALTAYQALFEHGGFACGWESDAEKAKNAGKRLLVTAAAGGVGVWALQLARAAGISSIIAVCGPGNIEYVKALGATEVIDYRAQSVGERYRAADSAKVDLVLDMVGGKTLSDCWSAIKDDGMVVSVHEPPETSRPETKRKSQGLWFIFEPSGPQLAEIADLVDSGAIKPAVDSVWQMDQYQEAFSRVDTGHARGKVVIRFPMAST